MPQNKTIKFFISSTFKDFLKERNALQNFVFPRLKELCQKEGFYFQPVDLRWGVTEESSEDNKTMEYCLNEVSRCSSDPKPNLLILFGQRYGWGPLPSYIKPDTFETIQKEIKNIDYTKGAFQKAKEKWKKEITKEENQDKKKQLQKDFEDAEKYQFKNNSVKNLLEEWYIQDLNDLDKRYFLKDKKDVNNFIWRFIEKTLKTYLEKVEITKNKDNYLDFHTSATEQEIRYALNEQYKADSDNTIVYFRKFQDESSDKDLIEDSQKAQEKLSQLQKYLEGRTEDNIKIEAVHNENISIYTYKEKNDDCDKYENLSEDLKLFCRRVYRKFAKKIKNEINNFESKSELKVELEEQSLFLSKKSIDVIGRDNEVREIVNFVNNNGNNEQFYLLYGKSGSGKTSVMAKAISELKDENLLYRFIGTTAHTTNPRDTYEYIYWQITDLDGEHKPSDIEYEDQKFYKQFHKAIKDYSNDKPLTLFIDAVDQFNGFDSLDIFLTHIPQNVKVVFSCLYDEEKKDNDDYVAYYKTLEHLKDTNSYKELQALEQSSNVTILKNWLIKDQRAISNVKENDQQVLVEEFIKGKRPLYIRLVYEIIREWKSTDSVDVVKNELADKEEDLIVKFFDNVVEKHYVKRELLELTLGLISASKDGLAESELIDILSDEKEILKLYERESSSYPELKQLPDSIFSKMYYHIQDVFTEKLIDGEMLINSYHRIIEEALKEKYYNESYHAKLANYFYTLQDKTKTWDQRYNNLHMLNEYPYQLFYAKEVGKLKEILFDLEFAGSIYDNHKQNSFRNIMEKASILDGLTEDEIYPWESFYREKDHLISKVDEELWRPHQSLFQLSYEDGLDSPLHEKVNNELIKDEKINWWYLQNEFIPNNYKINRTNLDLIINLKNYDNLKIQDIAYNRDNKLYKVTSEKNILYFNQYGILIKKEHNINDDILTQDINSHTLDYINEIIGDKQRKIIALNDKYILVTEDQVSLIEICNGEIKLCFTFLSLVGEYTFWEEFDFIELADKSIVGFHRKGNFICIYKFVDDTYKMCLHFLHTNTVNGIIQINNECFATYAYPGGIMSSGRLEENRRDTNLVLWNSNGPIGVYSGHSGTIKNLKLNNYIDDDELLSISEDKTARILQLIKPKLIRSNQKEPEEPEEIELKDIFGEETSLVLEVYKYTNKDLINLPQAFKCKQLYMLPNKTIDDAYYLENDGIAISMNDVSSLYVFNQHNKIESIFENQLSRLIKTHEFLIAVEGQNVKLLEDIHNECFSLPKKHSMNILSLLEVGEATLVSSSEDGEIVVWYKNEVIASKGFSQNGIKGIPTKLIQSKVDSSVFYSYSFLEHPVMYYDSIIYKWDVKNIFLKKELEAIAVIDLKEKIYYIHIFHQNEIEYILINLEKKCVLYKDCELINEIEVHDLNYITNSFQVSTGKIVPFASKHFLPKMISADKQVQGHDLHFYNTNDILSIKKLQINELDISFFLELSNGNFIASVDNTIVQWDSKGKFLYQQKVSFYIREFYEVNEYLFGLTYDGFIVRIIFYHDGMKISDIMYMPSDNLVSTTFFDKIHNDLYIASGLKIKRYSLSKKSFKNNYVKKEFSFDKFLNNIDKGSPIFLILYILKRENPEYKIDNITEAAKIVKDGIKFLLEMYFFTLTEDEVDDADMDKILMSMDVKTLTNIINSRVELPFDMFAGYILENFLENTK